MKLPAGTLLSPSETAAVVGMKIAYLYTSGYTDASSGGNVCTSQRITDVVLRAFNAAAASQGDCESSVNHRTRASRFKATTGNNFTFGQGGEDEKGQHNEGW